MEFLYAMEKLLALYQMPYDAKEPVLCFDERPCQMLGEVFLPWPLEAQRPKRQDYEYVREGTCTVFLAVEPLTGFRYVEVRQRRTREDYAAFMQQLAALYPEAKTLHVVQDNLNTHSGASFLTSLLPEQAFELDQRFHWHYTPKKASWLNMAEIELSALSKQCLDRRIATLEQMQQEVWLWAQQRNRKQVQIRWQFTSEQARDKFKNHYPTLRNL